MVLQLARNLVFRPNTSDEDALRAAGVPVTSDPCRTCGDPCDEGHEDFPKKFDIDVESELLGSVKPYRRQVIISTGKSDWVHEVTEEQGSLAKFLADTDENFRMKDKKHSIFPSPQRQSQLTSTTASPVVTSSSEKGKDGSKETGEGDTKHDTSTIAGVFRPAPTMRLSILNGSHTSCANDPDAHATVLVLPDYVAVMNVTPTPNGAEALWLHALRPALRRAGTVGTAPDLRTYILPYNCIIMLCSHKKRDMRCHIASQRLEEDFTRWLEASGWSVDRDLCGLAVNDYAALERAAEPEEEREAVARAELEALDTSTEKKALILKNSHVGGHKFAGNVIIYFPQGLGVWYGRVTPHEVPSIVRNTILGGKVLAPLLRGGLDISRPGCESLLDW